MSGALDFHHRDPKTKGFNISLAVGRRRKRDRIAKEIEKCDVICANCHRIIYWQEGRR